MKMKKLSVALIAAGLMSSQAVMASDAFGTSTSQNGLSFAFENSSTMNYAALSHTEMVETEGEWFLPLFTWAANLFRGASIGATSGALNYTAGWGASQLSDNPQRFSQPQFWSSAAGGAIGGPIGSRWGTAGNIGGGVLGSSVSGYYGNNNYNNNSNNYGRDFGSYCNMCMNGNGSRGWRNY